LQRQPLARRNPFPWLNQSRCNRARHRTGLVAKKSKAAKEQKMEQMATKMKLDHFFKAWFLAGCCIAAVLVPLKAALYPAQRADCLQEIQVLRYE
jgi:ABC-type lipoprotein release transport system permease subunit